MKPEISRQILKKLSNVRLQDSPSSGSRVVPCAKADGWMTPDTSKLMVTFRNSGHQPPPASAEVKERVELYLYYPPPPPPSLPDLF